MNASLFSDIEHVWQTIWRLGFYRGGPVFMSALSGIDIALWDLKGLLPTSRSSFQPSRFLQKFSDLTCVS